MELSELPPLIGGRYRPVRKLGEGAMGFIFEVEHEHTGDRLALKLMRAHASTVSGVVERFKREARASTRIKSEHVVRVIDADVEPLLGNTLYLVMELLEGTDLDRASASGPQPPSVVVEWLRQTALGLDRAHQLGIVHRDLKPENLFLTHTEHGSPLVKILDFGIAKTMEDAPGTTQSGQLVGTPLFMSPEQARASGEIGPAADRYALGLIAYRLLTGIDYWHPSPNIAGLIAQILYEKMPAPSERGASFGPGFDAWFLKACHRDPAERFDTARVLVEELARALGVDLGRTTLTSAPHGLPRALPEGMTPSAARDPSLAPTLTSATKDLRPRRRSTQMLWFGAAAAALVALGLLLARGATTPDAGARATGAQPASAQAAAMEAAPRASAFAAPVASGAEAEAAPPGPIVSPIDSAMVASHGVAPTAAATPAPRSAKPKARPQDGAEALEPPRRTPRHQKPLLDDPLADQK
jgi:eukaryotic-like serine/threonine-protein kinase